MKILSLFALAGALLLALFAGFPSDARANTNEQPAMESALDSLRAAAAAAPPQSPMAPPVKIDRLAPLQAAKAALKKAPSIYKGRKIKAIALVDEAIAKLNAGQEQGAIAIITKAIGVVQEGIRIGR